jgi:hypothetical protein
VTTEQFYKFKKESISALGGRLMEAINYSTESTESFSLTVPEAQLLNDALTLYHDVVHYNSKHPMHRSRRHGRADGSDPEDMLVDVLPAACKMAQATALPKGFFDYVLTTMNRPAAVRACDWVWMPFRKPILPGFGCPRGVWVGSGRFRGAGSLLYNHSDGVRNHRWYVTVVARRKEPASIV